MRPWPILLAAALFLAPATLAGTTSVLILERDGSLSPVTCVDQSDVAFVDGAFSPRCAVVWSGEIVRWDLANGAAPGSQLDAQLLMERCVDAERDAQAPDFLHARFLFDGMTLRVSTDFATARSCLYDLAQSGFDHAVLPIEDAHSGARAAIVVRIP